MALDSMQEIFDKIQAGRKPFWQVVRDTDVEERQVTAEASFEKMHATWRAMVESVDTYRADRRSVSGLVGGDAQRMWDYAAQQETLCGPYLQEDDRHGPVRGGVQRLHAPDRGGTHGGGLRRAAGCAGAAVPPGRCR